ncbi:hypothetical protein AZE42_11349 [Rhizopogon vesiculosus]|uniref:Uncharacterized protein n=1 Tax=Rhizopogon vesiculosus TaxID=180088 RepID=A0A1J8R7D1_9AGAM|nr:hypothetical protein AZE42_11349 [Rhizopogon vesiculosus]
MYARRIWIPSIKSSPCDSGRFIGVLGYFVLFDELLLGVHCDPNFRCFHW